MSKVLRGGPRPGAFILSESTHSRSRDNLTIKSGSVLRPGEVCGAVASTGKIVPLGRDTKNNLTVGSLTGGSGGTNGTFPLAFTGGVGSGAAGTFTVAGGALTNVTITNHGNYTTAPTAVFTASAGLTGAAAPITLTDVSPSDGSDDVAAISIYGYDASEADVMGAFVTRDAEVIEDALVWPEGILAADKLVAIQQLKDRGIIIRPRSYVG